MVASQTVGLSQEQVELVLRGLRFVRNSINMELLTPSEETAAQRARQLHEVDGLVRQLSSEHALRAN